MRLRVAVNPKLLYWALVRASLDADTLAGNLAKSKNWLGGGDVGTEATRILRRHHFYRHLTAAPARAAGQTFADS